MSEIERDQLGEVERRIEALAADFARRAEVYEAHPEYDTDRYLDGYATGMRVAEKVARAATTETPPAPPNPVPNGYFDSGLTDREEAPLVAGARTAPPAAPDTGDGDREVAERFLGEWARPYFGDDSRDAVACVIRAAAAAGYRRAGEGDLRARVEALADEPDAPYPAECSCPHGMGFQFHRYPCRFAGDVPKSAALAALANAAEPSPAVQPEHEEIETA